jgi:predicted nucleic acid-binding protein
MYAVRFRKKVLFLNCLVIMKAQHHWLAIVLTQVREEVVEVMVRRKHSGGSSRQIPKHVS